MPRQPHPPSCLLPFARAPFYSFPSAASAAVQGQAAFLRQKDGQTDSRGTAPLRRRRCRRRLERHCPRGFTRVRPREIPSFPVPPLPLPFLLPPSAPVNARALRFCRSGAAQLSVPQEVGGDGGGGGDAFGGGSEGGGMMEEENRGKEWRRESE